MSEPNEDCKKLDLKNSVLGCAFESSTTIFIVLFETHYLLIINICISCLYIILKILKREWVAALW